MPHVHKKTHPRKDAPCSTVVVTSERKHQAVLEVTFSGKTGNYKADKMDEAGHVKLPQACEAAPETRVPQSSPTCVHFKMFHTKRPFAVYCENLFCPWIYMY